MSAACETTKRIWLLLLARGGWWRLREVEIELGLQPSTTAWRVQRLKTSGSIKARKEPGQIHNAQYAVTTDCTIPHGITAGEVSLAMAKADDYERTAFPSKKASRLDHDTNEAALGVARVASRQRYDPTLAKVW